jgi:adenylylsulfate reductase subunit B
MSIDIATDKCIACGRCADICPGSLITLGTYAAIARPERCWGCASCVKECPQGAISLYLGHDIGGLGGRMTARRDGALTHWTVARPSGETVTITVDSRDSNKY